MLHSVELSTKARMGQMRVLFIGGFGRSGSTLLERLLGALPRACGLGEVALLWERGLTNNERCGCRRRFRECEFWRGVAELAFGGWDQIDVRHVRTLRDSISRIWHVPRLASGRLTDAQRAMVSEYAQYYHRIYQAAAALTGSRLVVDSSKHAALAFCLRWAPALDVRVVHLIRDPRGVAYSLTKHVLRPETDGRVAMVRHSPTRSAMLWTGHNLACDLLASSGTPVYRVRYEELLARPRETVRAIASFAGLDAPESALSYLDEQHVDLDVIHSPAGNPMRFATGRVPLRLDSAWRTAMPARTRRLVGALCSPLLVNYGYPLLVPSGGSEPAAPRTLRCE